MSNDWWYDIDTWWIAEAEALAALEEEAEKALEDIVEEEVSKVDAAIIYEMDKVTAWTAEELAYLKLQAEEVFIVFRDQLLADGLLLDDATRAAHTKTTDYMKNIFDATRVAFADVLVQILDKVEEEEEEEEDSTAAIVQTVKDSIGGLFSGIIEALAVCFEWLGERLEDLLRIPSNTLFEWLADIMPGGVRE